MVEKDSEWILPENLKKQEKKSREFIDEGNGIYDDGEAFIDCNEDQTICADAEEWYCAGELGNGIYDDDEDFTDEFTLLTDTFKVSRTKSSIMQGSGLELVELNNIWLARDYGIVRDEMEFRFNLPDDFDGFYRLELLNCRHCDLCDEESSSRSGMFSGNTEINFNQLQNTGQFSDIYNKTRTFGLQKLEFDSQP